ncbi:MAG: carboxypeptidase regulatory-like domain-containing protein, partial [Planctomycetes bacterium]|nr:carboxypeptidase regulatory-like domain-containing protein [Planctomycetota bacterium]
MAGTARSAAVPTTIEIRGRCVDDGGRPRSAGLELVGTELRGATDEFGVFALQVAVGAVPRRPVLACSAAGCATMEIALAEFAGPTLDDGIDIGEVRLSAGVDLPLRVVDGAGRAAAGCALELCRTVAGDETAIHARTRLPLTTDTTGAAVAPGVLVGGTWQVRSRSALVAVVAPREPFRLPFDLPCATLDVRIERPDPGDLIVGTVVTADDAAVANATVFALDEEERVVAEAVTDDSGTFALARAGAAPSDVRLAVPDVDGFERYLDLRPRPWGVGGGGGTWLRLRRAGELRLEVFAADTGLPIEAYSYRWSIPAAGIAGPRGAFAPVAAHPGGVALVGGVPAGGAEVEVVPDPAGAYARSLPVALPAGQRALTVFVPPRRPLVVRVVDDSGLPIGGSRVTVSRAGRELAAATTSSAGSATLAPGDPRSGVPATVPADHVPAAPPRASAGQALALAASAAGRGA